MWYRVEINKTDGTIASCTECAAPSKENVLVRYVKADSKSTAIASASAWYGRYRERVEHERLALTRNRCPLCGHPSRGYCDLCKDERRSARTRGCAPPEPSQEAVRAVKEAREPLAVKDKARSRPDLLRLILKRYDADPTTFRAWLVAQINMKAEK